MANQYVPFDLGVITVKQNANFERYWIVSDNFDMSTLGLNYKSQLRKSFGNKSIVLEFSDIDQSFIVDAPNKTIGLKKDANEMDIEPGDYVLDLRCWTNENDAFYLAEGILRVKPSSTIEIW